MICDARMVRHQSLATRESCADLSLAVMQPERAAARARSGSHVFTHRGAVRMRPSLSVGTLALSAAGCKVSTEVWMAMGAGRKRGPQVSRIVQVRRKRMNHREHRGHRERTGDDKEAFLTRLSSL